MTLFGKLGFFYVAAGVLVATLLTISYLVRVELFESASRYMAAKDYRWARMDKMKIPCTGLTDAGVVVSYSISKGDEYQGRLCRSLSDANWTWTPDARDSSIH